MGTGRADDPASQAWRPPARGECPRGSERYLLCAFDWLPVAGTAEGPAAQKHGALLLHAVGLGRHAGAPPSHALCRNTRAGRARGQPDGRDHRQPERQGRSKGGSALDPQGFDAGKKVTGRKRHILVDTLGLLLNVVVHPANVQDRDGAGWSSIGAPAVSSPSSNASSPMPATKEPRRPQPSPRPVAGSWRSSNAMSRIASSFCPSDGSSSARSHGSATTAAFRATSSATPDPPPPSFASP